MIQRHTILINPNFSANTGSTVVVNSSNLTTFSGYEVNNIQSLGGGITNSSNVRGFLNNENNDIIINSFFSYLTGNTTTSEFSEIYHSDQKLSNVFNDYYITYVVNNQNPNTAVIDSSLTGTQTSTFINNTIYNYDGFSPNKGMSALTVSINESTKIYELQTGLTTFTLEDSYYIPVFIKRNHKQISRLNFNTCKNIVSLLLNPPAPIAPNLFASINSGGRPSIRLSWSVVSNATTYNIYISTTQGGSYTLYQAVNGNVLNKNITDLSTGNSYYFVVKSVNSTGVSEYSNEVYVNL